MERLVELSAVSKRYRRSGSLVLDTVTLAVEAGTLTQVRGENGAGKSTLLRLACGFSRPSAGRVRHSYRELGYAPDRVVPPARMTARSYLAHLGRLAGIPAGLTSASRLADRLDLTPGLDAPLGTLSRGNLTKVVLIQALMRPVDLVVMDEPFAALDAAARAELGELIAERLSDGCTFLVTTHTDDLAGIGHRLVLAGGRLDEAPEAAAEGPQDAGLVAIDLTGPHPSTTLTPSSVADGGTGYLVPAGQVRQFLLAALAARLGVLRVNPVEPGERR